MRTTGLYVYSRWQQVTVTELMHMQSWWKFNPQLLWYLCGVGNKTELVLYDTNANGSSIM
jgi:hypothetical protein